MNVNIGDKYYYELKLMNGEIRRLEGVVKEVTHNGYLYLVLEYTGLSYKDKDANFNNSRKHYNWIKYDN